MFGLRSKQPPLPSRDELEVKLDSLRPGARQVRLEPEDVTGVIDLALERLKIAQESGTAALQAATDRLLSESAAAQALASTVLPPPPPLPRKSQ
jgi:hypothetical protein